MNPNSWITPNESAKEMLSRVFTDRLFSSHLPPPLHRVPLRLGNVLELVGPSPSAKTSILIEVAVNCILPNEWNGVFYGGLGRGVVFIDLDCRFDVLRLAQVLKGRIGSTRSGLRDERGRDSREEVNVGCDEELFAECMRRFLYVRCYDSFEFLSTLKTLCNRLEMEKKAHAMIVHLLMVDSIGAFYWVDRNSIPLPLCGNNRKNLSLQCVLDTVTEEIRKILALYPMLVIATKATISINRSSVNEVKGFASNLGKWPSSDTSYSANVRKNPQHVRYREYMPSVWQSFVTHRVLLQASDFCCPTSEHQQDTVFTSEWLLPSVNLLDNFVVKDAGVFTI